MPTINLHRLHEKPLPDERNRSVWCAVSVAGSPDLYYFLNGTVNYQNIQTLGETKTNI